MGVTGIIIVGLLILSAAAPFIALYAVSLVKRRQDRAHVRIQKSLFWVCVAGVLILEIQIRLSGGSGSLIRESRYFETTFFKVLLVAHIVGAVLTYLIWAFTLFQANRIYKRKVPGGFPKSHKRLGYLTIFGLFYTAVSAFAVSLFAFVL